MKARMHLHLLLTKFEKILYSNFKEKNQYNLKLFCFLLGIHCKWLAALFFPIEGVKIVPYKYQSFVNYNTKNIVIVPGFLGCVHRRNPYIRLELGFQNGRFSCDGSRFLCSISMHCIVNVENHQYCGGDFICCLRLN